MRIIILTITIISVSLSKAQAWQDTVTHPALAEYAAKIFFDENFFKSEVKLGATSMPVRNWIRLGAELEDSGTLSRFLDGTARSLNHFHAPNRPLASAGLTDLKNGMSAVRWAQNGQYQMEMRWEDWSWQKVRDHYYNYLTATSETSQDENLVNLLKGLGYQMHLIQDMSQPNHVRNDTHIIDGKGISGFETWAKEHNMGVIVPLARIPIMPVVDITLPFADPTLSPVARLSDTRTFFASQTPSASLGQGLAEYTNANFFSEDTVFASYRFATDHRHYFPYPRKENTNIQDYIDNKISAESVMTEDGKVKKGVWIRRVGEDGVSHLTRAGAASRFWLWLFGEGKTFYDSFGIDEVCFKDYAEKLIPRAVGYSKAMLDYFFRGELTVTIPPDTPPTGKRIRLNVSNSTPTGETMDGGAVDLMVIFRTYKKEGTQTSGILVPDGDYQYRKYALGGCPDGNPRCVSIGTSETLLDFDLSTDPIPPLARDISLVVVYRGKLGNEQDSVAFEEINLYGITGELMHGLPARGVYASTQGSSTTNTFGDFEISVRNTSTTIPSGAGDTELLVVYRDALSDPFQSQPVDSSENIKYVSETIINPSGIPTATTTDLLYTFSNARIPVTATDIYAYVIHTTQDGKVTHGYFDICEPTPIDFFNNSDFVCINSRWYPAGTPEALAAADQAGNRNNIDDDLDTYRHDFTNIYEKNSAMGNSIRASASTHDFHDPGPVPPATLQRLGYILTDYSFTNSFLPTWVHTDPRDGWTRTEAASLLNSSAVKNQTDPDGTYHYPGMYNMRGKPMWGAAGIAYFSSLPAFTCDYAELPKVP